MKAALINEVGRGFDIEPIEISAPVGREVLVDVRASGLCHSDLTVATKGMGFPTPSVWGHEVAGVVAAIGPLVSQFETGQHVVACLVQACGVCSACLSGRPHQCLNAAATLRPASAPPRISRDGSEGPSHQPRRHHIVLTSSWSQDTMTLRAENYLNGSKERGHDAQQDRD